MYIAKPITNGQCVKDIMYINLSLFGSESNSLFMFCSLLSASKLVICVAK